MHGAYRDPGGTWWVGGRWVLEHGVEQLDLRVMDGRVVELGRAPEGAQQSVHVDGLTGYPGWIDLQVNGGGGALTMDGTEEAIRVLARTHARHGTAALLPTAFTSPPEVLDAALSAIAAVARRPGPDEAAVLGAHLEGPFISPERPGIHQPRWILAPDRGLMDRWLQAAQGFLKVVTLAPERPGAIPLVDHLVRQGVRVSLGHSAADPSAVAQAVTAGATLVTHLYNAMGDLSGRRPGLVGAALAMPALTVEVIADGHHVDPVAIQAAYRAKGPGGMVGITDAITPAGLEGDGAFRLLGQPIEVRGGRVASPDGVLAGSALTLDVAARNLTAWLGLAPWELAQLLSTTPARVLGLERKGRIAPGADADFTLVDDAGRVRRTVVGGRTVYRAPNPQGAGGGARTAP